MEWDNLLKKVFFLFLYNFEIDHIQLVSEIVYKCVTEGLESVGYKL